MPIRPGIPPTPEEIRFEIERQLSLARRSPQQAQGAREEAEYLAQRLAQSGEPYPLPPAHEGKRAKPRGSRARRRVPSSVNARGGPGILRPYSAGSPLPQQLTDDEIAILGAFRTVARPNKDWRGK
jgi:hypothetical protein